MIDTGRLVRELAAVGRGRLDLVHVQSVQHTFDDVARAGEGVTGAPAGSGHP